MAYNKRMGGVDLRDKSKKLCHPDQSAQVVMGLVQMVPEGVNGAGLEALEDPQEGGEQVALGTGEVGHRDEGGEVEDQSQGFDGQAGPGEGEDKAK